MRTALTLSAVLAAASAGAQTTDAVPTVVPAAQSVPFLCEDGRIVEIAFPAETTAVLVIDDGEPTTMTAAASDAGARFVAPGLQWLVDDAGGRLSVVALDEDVTAVPAADPGVACAATTDAVEESDEAVTDDALVDDAAEAATE